MFRQDGEKILQSFDIWYEDRVAYSWNVFHLGDDLWCSCHLRDLSANVLRIWEPAYLRNPFGTDEAPSLNPGQTRIGKSINQLNLGRWWYRFLLILQPIPRTHFHDVDIVRRRGGRPPSGWQAFRQA